jgi:hypothetical protein
MPETLAPTTRFHDAHLVNLVPLVLTVKAMGIVHELVVRRINTVFY